MQVPGHDELNSTLELGPPINEDVLLSNPSLFLHEPWRRVFPVLTRPERERLSRRGTFFAGENCQGEASGNGGNIFSVVIVIGD